MQYVTHSASARSWPEGLPEAWCQVAGEIVIEVSRDGSRYTIEDRRERSYSERQEDSQRDARPR